MLPWIQTLLAGMALMMSAATGLIAYGHAADRNTGYLSAALLAGAFWGVLPTFAAYLALPPATQALLALALLAAATWASVQYLLHQIAASRVWIGRVLLLQVMAAPLSLWLAPPALANNAHRIWCVLMSLALLLGIARYVSVRRRRMKASINPTPQQWREVLLAGSLLGAAAVSLWAIIAYAVMGIHLGLLVSPGAFNLIGLPLALLGHGLLATVNLAQARKTAEAQQDQLEQAMIERVAEVERSFGEMAEQKLEQVTERERKRIAADLHDDLGAKLLTIVHTSESDRISTLAREALEEMRLSVRGLTGKPVQLLDALGDWRAEVVSRLGQANILAEWKSPAEDIVHTLPAPCLRANHTDLSRSRQQHHQAQRRHSLHDQLQRAGRRLHGGYSRQWAGDSGRVGWATGPRSRHGQHEVACQTDARPMSGGVGPRLGNRDSSHDSALNIARFAGKPLRQVGSLPIKPYCYG